MKNKILTMLLSVSMVSLSLSGCGAANSESESINTPSAPVSAAESDSGVVELTVWVEDVNVDCTSKMLESFKQEYANEATFEITIVENPDSDTKDNLLEDIHNGADVFPMPDDQLYGMIAAGALSPVINADTVRSENLEEAIDAASYNGTLYAYPYSADNGYFLYYDKNYFTEDDVKTLDRILEVAAEAGKKFTMEFDSGWYLYSFFGGTGLEFGINDDGVTNYCNWNSTENAIKGVDVTEALLSIASHPGFLSAPNDEFADGIRSGEVIAGIGGVWNAVQVKAVWGDDYGACKLPTYTCAGKQVQMSSFTGYKMMGVNAYSKQTEWAHKLAEWLTNEENQALRFVERSQGPSNKNAASSDAVSKVPAIAAVIDQSQYGTLQRVGNSFWNACSSYAKVLIDGNPNNIPLQELVDTLTNGIAASTVQ
ncbi:MAG: extracellular solute-binding protein [Acetatifactor sp.]